MNQKIEDLLVSIVESRPADAGETLQSIMVEKLRDVVEIRKEEVAEEIFNTNEESEGLNKGRKARAVGYVEEPKGKL